MNLPQAVKTVKFSSPLTGAQLRGLLQQVATDLVCDERYFDGPLYELGQTSGYPFDHIRVVPTLESPYVRPDEEYNQVMVTSHSWGGTVYAVGYDSSSVVNAVVKFAEQLEASANSALESGEFPEFTATSRSYDPFDED